MPLKEAQHKMYKERRFFDIATEGGEMNGKEIVRRCGKDPKNLKNPVRHFISLVNPGLSTAQ